MNCADNKQKIDVLNAISAKISTLDNFIICSHIDPDGDAIGSSLALFHALKKINKKSVLCFYSKIPQRYQFLPGCSEITPELPLGFQNLIAVDAPNMNRLGFSDTNWQNLHIQTTINIDHHVSNCNFGDFNLVDSTACASAELVLELIKKLNIVPDSEISTCIFTGITTDTGCFKYSNTTSKSHIYAAECIAAGINQELVMKHIYASFPLARLELEAMVLSTLKIKNRVSWVYCDWEMTNKCGYEDTEDIVNRLVEIKDSDIAIFFREPEKNIIKVSLRSSNNANVSQIASEFGGGGHAKAAGVKMSQTTMAAAIDKITKACFNYLEKSP